MGNSKSKDHSKVELPEEAMEIIKQIFEEIDKDNSGSIDKKEAINYWDSNFGKISASAFFENVDINNDGYVEYEEFVDFWKLVKHVGHTDEEIMEELQNLRDKQTWCGFNDIPKHASK
mmetsp:Transcript_28456/g.32543  ORF Transcript_28456/g.32543 Transcript_28456/m.32543 type:complete len:118 (-) Transcript_28456:44-397(-)